MTFCRNFMTNRTKWHNACINMTKTYNSEPTDAMDVIHGI